MNANSRRILVIANETIEADVLHDAVRRSAGEAGSEVLVIAPALNSRVRHWASDEDAARRGASVRLGNTLERLEEDGIHAIGYVGDADPMQAISDGLFFFPADEIIVATHPTDRSNWLERDLIARACAASGLPVVHVVAHPAVERAALLLDAA